MEINISAVFTELGGVANVARLLNAPVTTVWAWKKSNRIPASRLSHLRLAIEAGNLTCEALDPLIEERAA